MDDKKTQSGDKTRRERFEDVAARELGLTEIEVKRGQFNTPCKAIVEFRMLGARETPDFFPFSKLEVVAAIAERHGERLRVVSHGGHFIDGMATVGGNDGANSDGVGGLWTVVSISEYAEDAAALAIQRASMHRTFRKDALPDGVRAIPEGRYKDAAAPAVKSFSLWSTQRLHKISNRELQDRAMAMLVCAGQARKKGVPIDTTVLMAPRMFVAADAVEPIKPRFLATDIAEGNPYLEALDVIDDVTAWCSTRGTWDIDGLLVAGVSGKVKEVHAGGCVIEGETEDTVFEAPTAKIVQLIRARTGFYLPNLQLVPLVKEGEHVGSETVLYGPMDRLSQAAPQQFRRIIGSKEDGGTTLCGARLMALLASAVEVDGHTLYPIELVAPSELKQLFVQVAGDGVAGRWSARIQRIALDRHPSKHLLAAGPGFSFNLFSTSHRSVAMQRIKSFRLRAKEREEEERKAKKAARREEQRRRKQAAVTEPAVETEGTVKEAVPVAASEAVEATAEAEAEE